MLLENLFAGDLDGVLHPVISIDDFESKIDENTIVIAFYLKNEESAEDLSVFLERSAISRILDTEVSSSTNKNGDFIVFVELDNSSKDNELLTDVIMDVVRVCSTLIKPDTSWRIKNIRTFGNKLYRLTPENVLALLDKLTEK